MLEIAICDDDNFENVLIATYMRNYQKAHTNLDINVTTFFSSSELWNALDSGKDYDIYLLDILMPEISGLDLGKKLRDSSRKGVIIYMTGSKDYALDAFQVFAMQYMVKPIVYDTFCSAIDMALDTLQPALSSSFPVNTSNGTIKVRYSAISYIECVRHVLQFHLTDGSIVISRNIRVPFESAIAPLLTDSRFVRIHQSYVVNLTHVSQLTNMSFILDNGKELPISKNKYSEIKSIYLSHIHLT